MKEMTTAEFAKANLAALEEPVSVRRYTQVVGTYYPKGYEPASAPPQPTLGLDEVKDIAPASTAATAKIIEDLTEEVKQLKKRLAEYAAKELATSPLIKGIYPAGTAVGQVVPKPTKRSDEDPFVGLAPQDRAFFERKLGTGKKKS